MTKSVLSADLHVKIESTLLSILTNDAFLGRRKAEFRYMCSHGGKK